MLVQLFLDTTQPDRDPLLHLRDPRVYVSAAFHTVLYLGLALLVSFVFGLKGFDTKKFSVVVGLIMVGGYVARQAHVNRVYRAYGEDTEGAREHVRKHYTVWYFLG